MYISKNNLICPMCGGKLIKEENSPLLGLTNEEFDMIKAGDYHCPDCPDPERMFEKAYFWVKED